MRLLPFALLIPLLVHIGGCKTQPIRDVENQPYLAPASAATSDVDAAIRKACAAEKWDVRAVIPGKLLATRRSGAIMARVSIVFDSHSFSIRYVASERFLESGGRIHRSYNRWVEELSRAIEDETGRLE